ncbi:hypothetical protein Tco_1517190 [Tanacetum coccineum]
MTLMCVVADVQEMSQSTVCFESLKKELSYTLAILANDAVELPTVAYSVGCPAILLTWGIDLLKNRDVIWPLIPRKLQFRSFKLQYTALAFVSRHCAMRFVVSYTVCLISRGVVSKLLSSSVRRYPIVPFPDTRAWVWGPMLDRTDFASWQQRIRFYYRGKENGVNILKSIDEEPFQIGTFREKLAEGNEGALHLGPERARVYSDLSPEDKDRYNADIRATNILLQGLPKDIYTLIKHYTDAKDIWDNVKMLLEGSELTKEDHESQLYDDFEHFHQNKGETIHDYYVRFTKLINDMRNIKMTMPRMQLNTKFVNNMFPEWGRFVIVVKLNKGLRDSNYDQLYAYLKQHEEHANENKMMLERFTQHNVDPLALMSNVSHQ